MTRICTFVIRTTTTITILPLNLVKPLKELTRFEISDLCAIYVAKTKVTG